MINSKNAKGTSSSTNCVFVSSLCLLPCYKNISTCYLIKALSFCKKALLEIKRAKAFGPINDVVLFETYVKRSVTGEKGIYTEYIKQIYLTTEEDKTRRWRRR